MQLSTFLATVTVAVFATTAHAAKCGVDDLTKLSEFVEAAQSDDAIKACAAIKGTNAQTPEGMKKLCADSKCIEFMRSLTSKVPDCDAEGKNPRKEWEANLKQCDPNVRSTAVGPSSASTAVVITAVGLAGAAAAWL